jgi:hypothetical protein
MPANPDGINVRVVQVDATGTKPWDEPMAPSTDGFKTAAVFLVDPSNDDKLIALWRDGDDLRLRDVTNPGTAGGGYTLTELIAGAGGITETQHRVLRQLIHFIDEGPAEGFVSGAYKEILPSAAVFPTSVIWWESSSKLKKIVEKLITWTGVNPTTIIWKIYDTDGTTVLATVTDAISYSGIFETTRTRTIA